jgi:hypothetical protein
VKEIKGSLSDTRKEVCREVGTEITKCALCFVSVRS